MTAELGNGRRKKNIKMPGYQAFSFTRRASAATAKLLLCRLTENVGVIPLFSCLEIRFCQLFAVYFTSTFFILRSTFLGFLLSEKSNQNVSSVNRLSNSSLCVVVLFPPKTSAPCVRVRNDRNWREKLSSRSSLPAAMSAVVEQALVLS